MRNFFTKFFGIDNLSENIRMETDPVSQRVSGDIVVTDSFGGIADSRDGVDDKDTKKGLS